MKKIIETKVNFLDEKSFSSYGEVIGFKEKEPEISDNDLAYWPSISEIKLSNDIGQISLLELKRKRQFVCNNFERHMNCSEAHFPLVGQSIVLLALDNNIEDPSSGLDTGSIKAFIMDGSKAINIKKGIWHCLPFPVSKNALIAIVFEKDTHINDVEIYNIKKRNNLSVKINWLEGDKHNG